MGAKQGLVRLTGFTAGPESLAKGGLEPVKGGLGKGPPVIVDGEFPSLAAKEPGLFDGAVALARVVAGVKHGALARWREQVSMVAPRRGVAHTAVVSAVANDDGAGRRQGDVEHVAQHLESWNWQEVTTPATTSELFGSTPRWILRYVRRCRPWTVVSHVPGPRICRPVESTTMQPPALGHAGNATSARRRHSVDGSGTGKAFNPARSRTERSKPTVWRNGSR